MKTKITRDKKGRISFHALEGDSIKVNFFIDEQLHWVAVHGKNIKKFENIGGRLHTFKKHRWLSFPGHLTDDAFSEKVCALFPEVVESVRETRETEKVLKEINKSLEGTGGWCGKNHTIIEGETPEFCVILKNPHRALYADSLEELKTTLKREAKDV